MFRLLDYFIGKRTGTGRSHVRAEPLHGRADLSWRLVRLEEGFGLARLGGITVRAVNMPLSLIMRRRLT